MNRREFLKSTLAATVCLSTCCGCYGKEKPDGKNMTNKVQGSQNEEQVTRRKYKNTNLTLPLLGFGMMRLPRIDESKQDVDYALAEKMIADAMKAGCNYFDTAYMYHNGLSEKCVGDLLSKYPRDSYYLADKMPAWMANSAEDIKKIFAHQLERTKAGYFDFYLIHCVEQSILDLIDNFKVYEFLSQMKKEGKIRQLGFSFHDTPEVLEKFLDKHEWDFVQIQLNYLDWDLYRSREQYEMITKRNIPVIVMEPLRGGALSVLNPASATILKNANPNDSITSWALRFVASLPNVVCVLSGMSHPDHMIDNLSTFSPFKPLTDDERKTLQTALEIYRKNLAVPCTGCRYCLPCPMGIEIPRIFGLYNQYRSNLATGGWLFTNNYGTLPENARADACIACGKCAKHCPQHIQIPDMMKKIHNEVQELLKVVDDE